MGQECAERPDPFFIVGMQRSGTTMLRLMLNSHRNLAVPFESGFIPTVYKNLRRYGDLSIKSNAAACLRDISELPLPRRGKLIENPESVLAYPIRNYADLVEAAFAEYARRKGKSRWGEKTPGQLMDLDILWKLFPTCRIIHLVRDGRDVALSLLKITWGPRNLITIAENWRWNTILGHKIGTLLKGQYFELRYEDLVRNPAQVLREICAFLGEPYDENMLAYHSTATAEIPEVSIQWHRSSVSPPDPSKVGLWKRQMPLCDRILFEQVAGDALELFGYERQHHPSTLTSRIKKAYYCLWKRY